MANMQPMHHPHQVFVQGSSSTPISAYPHASIPYHIYQNVVLAALNTSNVSDVKPHFKTELLDAVTPTTIAPVVDATANHHLFKPDSTVATSVAELVPISTAQQIKSEFTPTNNSILPPPAQVLQQLLQPTHLETIQPTNIADGLSLSHIPQHQLQHGEQQQLQQQQQQFLMSLPLSLNPPTQGLPSAVEQPTVAEPSTTKKKKSKSKGSTDKIHSCPECSYTCNRADKLKVHIKGVHNNDKPFPCEFCGKGFKQRDKLSRHTNTVHYRERPFACDYCPLAFGRKDKVKRHVSTVHLMERPYRCNFCSHNTTRKDKMRIHLQQVHQSVDGSEHYIIERQPQPPPRVLTANTNRNISDIVGNQQQQQQLPPAVSQPSTVATTSSMGSTATSNVTSTISDSILGLPDISQIAAPQLTMANGSNHQTTTNLVSLAPANIVSNVMTNLVAPGTLSLPNSVLQVGEENSQNTINNGAPLRVVTKL